MSKKPARHPAQKPAQSDTEARLRLERARVRSVKRLAASVERESRTVVRAVERADRAQLLLARLIADRHNHTLVARDAAELDGARV